MSDMKTFILFAVSIASYVGSRIYYLKNIENVRNNDAIYPIVEQQVSHDLAFSAGDPVERTSYLRTKRLTEPAPTRRDNFEDVIFVPQRGRKLMKLNGNKGEVILELRVIANHDSV